MDKFFTTGVVFDTFVYDEIGANYLDPGPCDVQCMMMVSGLFNAVTTKHKLQK